ncbi:Transcriptional activator domain [Nostocoides japonicum T1-X7]|uniref:Transcriptional activator domain n=1 Tax=Nostocoides japonicum T1-X7 TaxID=1194083 RepID=A0A077LXY6_9MICO|nr:AfsR/SARP family transcriptional regulator [Tetrasphaera japonica]CCH76795.1 Transcriptional activator domain [Tetrasphaera japonica T1-X7]
MELAVLGPVLVVRDGDPVDLGTRKQRALVAALGMARGRPVSVDTIVDLLWGDAAPPGVAGTLQAYVAGLRRALEPDRPARAPARVLVTVPPGYALRLPDRSIDAVRVDHVVAEAHRVLASLGSLGAPRTVDSAALEHWAGELTAALALWRGEPYADLGDSQSVVAERARLEELRLVALEDLAVARLALGRHGTVAADLEQLTAAHPLRERLWGLRALALTRSGRQAEALEVLREVRQLLDDELGIEPSPELRQLQTAVLRQDPVLEWTPPPSAPVSAVPGPPLPATPGSGSPHPGDVPPDQDPASRSGSPPASAPDPAAPGDIRPDPAQVSGPDARSSAVQAIRGPRHGPSGPLWPLVGRDAQLDALVATLEASEEGPAFAYLVGDPGIGKSRLAAELAAHAESSGVTVSVGRCSQDEGAPPLRPWRDIILGLGADLPDLGEEHVDGAQFRAWDAIVSAVLEVARDRPVLLVVDDLHWASQSTLRTLRLLVESAERGRIMVVLTWRRHPEPDGLLADVAELLARRHALRIELRGLGADAAGDVVEAVVGMRPSTQEAAALRARTDGNPFFLVEYARLAAERGDLGDLLHEDSPPAAVQDVLRRRLTRLPVDTLGILRTAAVIGRDVDIATLARAEATDADTLLDLLEPARIAGLVRDEGDDRYAFSHALVVDTLRAGVPPSRLARSHVKVAQALEGTGRASELARHWLAAGPAYATPARQATVAAASAARGVHAHEEATELLLRALDIAPHDPTATLRDRYDLLMLLVESYRWRTLWPQLVATIEEAIEVAEEIGDPDLVGGAAISMTVGGLWRSAPAGEVNPVVVDALRRTLDALPEGDGPLRCRVMASLANETFYAASHGERRALLEESLAMARRLGDRRLLLDVCQILTVTLSEPDAAPERLERITEAVALSAALGGGWPWVVSTILRAATLNELGLVDELWVAVEEGRQEAERLKIPFGHLVLDTLELPWRAMAGDSGRCEELLASIRRGQTLLAIPQDDDAIGSVLLSLRAWQGRLDEAVDIAVSYAELQPPNASISPVVAGLMSRAGRLEEARSFLEAHPFDHADDHWHVVLGLCFLAETGLALGRPDLAAPAYEELAPLAGRVCCAGSALAFGPVDAFLALAAAATGETALASRHADAALALCEAWDIPLAARWLVELRERHAF